MRGFPRHLNTKVDYLHVRAEFPADQWQPKFQLLLDGRFAWLPVGPLADGDAGVADSTHRVVEHADGQGQIVERVQEEWREDPNATIFRLGFTVAEVEALLQTGG
jgi:hypothetical protein